VLGGLRVLGFFSLLLSLPASLPLSSVCRLPQAILRDSTDDRGGGATRKEGRGEVLESTGMNGRWQSGSATSARAVKYLVQPKG
jgi:hypothetical protein